MSLEIENKLDNIKKRLNDYGITDVENLDNYSHWLLTKHFSRYVQLANFYKNLFRESDDSMEFKISFQKLSILYQIDVVIRRIISEILKPLELKLTSALSLILGNIKHLLSWKYYEDINNSKDFYNTLASRKFILDAVTWNRKKQLKKAPKTKVELWQIITRFTLGQTVALINLLSNKYRKDLFKIAKISPKAKASTFNDFVALRNHISHHNILLNIDGIKSNKKNTSVSDLILSIDLIANNTYIDRFKKQLDTYKKNYINKHSREHCLCKCDDNDQMKIEDCAKKFTTEELTKLFEYVINHFF